MAPIIACFLLALWIFPAFGQLFCSQTEQFFRVSAPLTSPLLNENLRHHNRNHYRKNGSLLDSNLQAKESNGTSWTISIAFTTDMHGEVMHLSKLVEFTREFQNNSKNDLVLVNTGDISISTSFSRRYGDRAVSQALEMVGFQAMALGNHDLEYIDKLPTNFPILSINTPGFNASHILTTKNGFKVGLIGYTAHDNMNEENLTQSIISEATRLRTRKGMNLVILLGHGGIDLDKDIAQKTRGIIDVVIGGHSHDLRSCHGTFHMPNDNVVHCGSSGSHLCLVNIHKLIHGVSISSNAIPFDTLYDNWTIHNEVSDWLAPKASELQKITAKHINSSLLVDHKNCRFSPCLTGVFITEAIKHFYCKKSSESDCVTGKIIFYESGSMRRNLNGILSEETIYDMIPWNNYLVNAELTGRQVHALLNRSQRLRHLQAGGYFQVSGLSYNVQSRKLYTHHISALQTLSSDQIYNVILTDWIFHGGDGYESILKNISKYSYSKVYVREVVQDFVSSFNTPDLIEEHFIRLSDATKVNSSVDRELTFDHLLFSIPYDENVAKPHTKKSFWIHGLIGIIAEFIAVTLIYPLLTMTTRRQAQVSRRLEKKDSETENTLFTPVLPRRLEKKNSERESTQLEEKLPSLFDGFWLLFFTRFMNSFVYWNGYYYVKFAIEYSYQVKHSFANGFVGFVAGIIAGIINTIVTNPLWVTLTYIQVHGNYPNSYHRLCDGLGIGLLLVCHPSIRQFIFEFLAYFWEDFQLLWFGAFQNRTMLVIFQPFLHGFIGILATIVATTTTYPLQVYRTRLQAGITSMPNTTKNWFAGISVKLLSSMSHEFLFFFTKRVIEMLFLE